MITVLSFLNSLPIRLKFTSEYNETEINFFDIAISINGDKRQFQINGKLTQTDLIIPANSDYPWQHKCSPFQYMGNRLVKITLYKDNYNKEQRRTALVY